MAVQCDKCDWEMRVKDQQWVVLCFANWAKDTLFGYKQEAWAKFVEVRAQGHSLEELRLDVLVEMKIVTHPMICTLLGPAPNHISAGLSSFCMLEFFCTEN